MQNNSRDALYTLLLFIFNIFIHFLAAPSDSKAALQSKIVAEFVVSSELDPTCPPCLNFGNATLPLIMYYNHISYFLPTVIVENDGLIKSTKSTDYKELENSRSDMNNNGKAMFNQAGGEACGTLTPDPCRSVYKWC